MGKYTDLGHMALTHAQSVNSGTQHLYYEPVGIPWAIV